MSDAKEMKKKLKRQIDKMDEDKISRKKKDKSRVKKWAKRVLGAAWDVIKSAVGGLLGTIFGI